MSPSRPSTKSPSTPQRAVPKVAAPFSNFPVSPSSSISGPKTSDSGVEYAFGSAVKFSGTSGSAAQYPAADSSPSSRLNFGFSPKSASDSGVEDVFDSPIKAKIVNNAAYTSPTQFKFLVEDSEEENQGDTLHEPSDGSATLVAEEMLTGKAIPDDPFASEHSRILFEAIDELQTYGSSEFLDIPQLIIVGGQSTGKSSLLQSLTEIPFPVGTGCCTRFPTRIVSRRTAPGQPDSFRITIEKASQGLKGTQTATGKFERYKEGEPLSTEEFINVVEEISTKHMGIRKGQGPDKKNFAADVLKIELSGPNRSYFSILDLPGIFQNASEVNESDISGVKKMIVEYMKRPENIVICVADALTDLDNHEILKMASDHVDEQRRVGVFTKCDMIKPESSLARKIVSDAKGKTMPGGWFLVRNRTEDDSKSLSVQDAEDTLFSQNPWTSIAENRLGSAALKTHLGCLLSAKIRSSFPSIQADIRKKLMASMTEKNGLGQARSSHLARQQYLIGLVRRYEDKAKVSLERPGLSSYPALELRREINRLNDQFDQFMRSKGTFWEFEENATDPGALLERGDFGLNANGSKKKPPAAQKPGKTPTTEWESAFESCSHVCHSGFMRKTIEEALENFRGAQLPGVLNADIYPIIYRQQVQKWTKITEIHLKRVRKTVETCYKTLLSSICPAAGGTLDIHNRLMERLSEKFKDSFDRLEKICMSDCRREAECTMPLTNDPRFEEDLNKWRRLRLCRRIQAVHDSGTPWAAENVDYYFHCLHLTSKENMINEVHDIVRVYYTLSMGTFIRDITVKYVEDFISDSTGPIKGLNTDYIMSLSEAEVEKLASENDTTLKRRRELDEEITRLDRANSIAERASERTSDLDSA